MRELEARRERERAEEANKRQEEADKVSEKREDKRPLMSDLRQSGNMEEDADIMIGLYRDEMYFPNSPAAGTLEFLIRKSRNGPTGMVLLRFDGETVNITDNKLDSWDEESFI